MISFTLRLEKAFYHERLFQQFVRLFKRTWTRLESLCMCGVRADETLSAILGHTTSTDFQMHSFTA